MRTKTLTKPKFVSDVKVDFKNKEKHFVVPEIEFDEEGTVIYCCIEAVMTIGEFSIDWHSLNDNNVLRHGWK